jgi:DNA-binding MarR family transcriptional regulator
MNTAYIINLIFTMKAEKNKLIDQIIEVQRQIDRARRQYETDIWMVSPLTRAQLKSLFFISNQGRTCLVDLANALGVTPTNITGIIDRLAKQGLVNRDENPRDRRMFLISTTEKGEEFVASLRARNKNYWKNVLNELKMDELTKIIEGLKLTVDAIDTYDKEFPETNL